MDFCTSSGLLGDGCYKCQIDNLHLSISLQGILLACFLLTSYFGGCKGYNLAVRNMYAYVRICLEFREMYKSQNFSQRNSCGCSLQISLKMLNLDPWRVLKEEGLMSYDEQLSKQSNGQHVNIVSDQPTYLEVIVRQVDWQAEARQQS